MGDRTTVTLTVLNSQAETAKLLFEEEADHQYADSDEFSFVFYEINYGELPFLNSLKAAGIAYNSEWNSGNNYDAGSQYGRFTPDGDYVQIKLYDGGINPDIHDLVLLLDRPEKLRQYIISHVENTIPLPWDNQEEYGKRYQAKQLINPD